MYFNLFYLLDTTHLERAVSSKMKQCLWQSDFSVLAAHVPCDVKATSCSKTVKFYGPSCCALRRGSTAPTSRLKHEWHVKYIIHILKVTHTHQQSKRVTEGGNGKKLEEKGKQCLLWLRSNSLHRIKSAYKMVNLEQMGPRILNLLQQSCLDKQNFDTKRKKKRKRFFFF